MKNSKKEGYTLPVKHLSVTINASTEKVYNYASNPENMPEWAQGLAKKIYFENGVWKAETSFGDVEIYFTPQNEYGILDHKVVVLKTGEAVENPVRIIPNNKGCEVVFTLLHLLGRTDRQFEEDAGFVQKDLNTLKEIMER